MKINERLRRARKRAGFRSAAEAAKHLKVPYGTYSGHESGFRGVKASEITLYAAEFGVSVAWLSFGESGGPPAVRETTIIGEVSSETAPYISGFEVKDRLVAPLPAECNDRSNALVIHDAFIRFMPPNSVVFFDRDVTSENVRLNNQLCIVEFAEKYLVSVVKSGEKGSFIVDDLGPDERIYSARPVSAILPLPTVIRALQRRHVQMERMAEALSSAASRHRNLGSIAIEDLD